MVVLRNFALTDLDSIERIERKAFPEGPYERSLLLHIFTDNRSLNQVALISGEIVGYIVAMIMDRKMADIENIAIDPEHSRKGVGSALMNAMEMKLRAMEVQRIILEVRDQNTEAISFYIKHGYRKIDYLKNYYVERYRGSRNAYRMMKVIRIQESA